MSRRGYPRYVTATYSHRTTTSSSGTAWIAVDVNGDGTIAFAADPDTLKGLRPGDRVLLVMDAPASHWQFVPENSLASREWRTRSKNPRGLDVSGTIDQAAAAAAGNWKRISDFGWFAKPDDADRYMLHYIRNRDSGILDQSNADVLEKAMKKFRGVELQRHQHFAVGWVEALVVPVYDKRGKITAAFKKFVDLMRALDEQPVLDETDYSARELQATLENIEEVGRKYVRADAGREWPAEVYGWLSDNDDSEIENRDDQGGYPSDQAVALALHHLRLLDEDSYETLKDELPPLPEVEDPRQMKMFNPRRRCGR